jgi:DNA modification methylase
MRQKIQTISIRLLKENPITEKLYGKFDSMVNLSDFDLVKSIEKYGIKEPLVVTKDNYVINGNRRLKAAKKLRNITLINVIVEDVNYKDLDELTIITYQQQRVKDEVAVAWEFERLTEIYGIGSGKNNNQEDLRTREKLLKKSKVSRSTVGRVKAARKLYMKLHKCSDEEGWNFLRHQLRELGKEVNTILEELQRKERKEKNKNRIKPLKDFRNDWIKIIRADNENLKGLVQDKSIDCSISSPPYFAGVRTYLEDKKTGKKTKPQKGHEKTIEEYIESQMRTYREVKRTLKDTGSIWINIADTFKDGQMLLVHDSLARAVMNEGLKLKQTIIWVKNNPLFQDRGIYQQCVEHIYHFVKDPVKYKWKGDWLDEADEFLGEVTYGAKIKKRQFKNVMYFPTTTGGVLKTNANDSHPLKKLLASKGIELKHSAMFPYEVPMICILSTADRGDNILDPYHGMGTSALVAYAYDCHYWGIEYSTEYAKHSVLRIEDFIQNFSQQKRPSKTTTKHKKTTKAKL